MSLGSRLRVTWVQGSTNSWILGSLCRGSGDEDRKWEEMILPCLCVNWVSLECHLGVTRSLLECHLGVTWVSLGRQFGVTLGSFVVTRVLLECHLGDYLLTIGRAYACPMGSIWSFFYAVYCKNDQKN